MYYILTDNKCPFCEGEMALSSVTKREDCYRICDLWLASEGLTHPMKTIGYLESRYTHRIPVI